ncbi:MAG TPA: class I SAM-dependent methyltransferase [Nakamurella sp.]
MSSTRVPTRQRVVRRGRQVLLLPRVARLAGRAPKDRRAGWDRYWGSVRSTGVGGDVLWDAGDLDESATYRLLAADHLDTALPLVDVGCGNGRFTRQLASLFPRTIGVDLSANAVALARTESAGRNTHTDTDTLTYRRLDVTRPGAGRDLAAAIGQDANVFVRGVFHVLEPADRVVAARNLRAIVGAHGRVLLAETNFQGSKMDYLQHLGATPWHIPSPVERAIADIPAPGHFGAPERRAAFPAAAWRLVADGAADIMTIPLHGDGAAGHIPGYYAILQAAVPTPDRPA